MTRKDILKEILTECVSNYQPELAGKYHVSPSDISHLLQECGFINRKFDNKVIYANSKNDENSASIDIDSIVDTALKKTRVQRISDKILKAQAQSQP